MTTKNKKTGLYMCATDFEEELGNAFDGNRIYPSLKALKLFRKCISECGYVRVDVILHKKKGGKR